MRYGIKQRRNKVNKFKNTEELEKAYKELEKEFTKKSQKLATYEKDNFVALLNREMDSLLDDYAKRRIADLEAKLAEKDEQLKLTKWDYDVVIIEYNKLFNTVDSVIERQDQDKISFAVEQIMQIREKIDDSEKIYMGLTLDGMYDLDNIFDNKIAELTHQHEDKGE